MDTGENSEVIRSSDERRNPSEGEFERHRVLDSGNPKTDRKNAFRLLILQDSRLTVERTTLRYWSD